MKTVFEHIEHIKGKPHHVRRRVAFATAAGVSALIGFVWLVGSFATGSFAIQGSDFAMSTGRPAADVVSSSEQVGTGLAGAASAIQSANEPAHIEIVDTTTSTPKKNQSEQTILPF
jgi:hypothetical protein